MNPLALTLLIATLLFKVGANLAQVDCPICTDGLSETIGSNRNSSTCNNGVADQYAQCLDCEDQILGDSVAESQIEYDAYVFLCAHAGFELKNQTVAGSYRSTGDTASRNGAGFQAKTGGSVHLRASPVVGWITIGVLSTALI
ncbi:hypothetical protein MSAN_01697700 [Mycena sanguinolenta]|uniref:Uncharacterized protein n=1 Tax=Mycena sanguinolenta TaxID=230812 RepID=A0A8H6XZN7_9AGAR|nr:hypothetical protein MSAN_01697700 [Mycena sanguinolenta]